MAATPYSILGAKKGETDFQLRSKYRDLIHELKADRKKPPQQRTITPEKFRQICRAYETVSDHEKRQRYIDRQEWISDLPIPKYSLQQLAAEPDLALELKERLKNAKLRQIDEKHPITGHTPLYCAARACNVDAVYYLIEQGADPDLKQRTGSTALHAAAFFGHAEMVRSLLESGADYRIQNGSNNVPETEAYSNDARQAFIELKETLFVKAANNQLDWFKNNVHSIDDHIDKQYHAQRQTLLQCACKKGHFQLAVWLIEERNANLDVVDINSNSALHLAAYGGHADIVDYLLRRGANPTLINKWGTTAEQEDIVHKAVATHLFQAMRDKNPFEMAKQGIDWWFQYYFDKSPNTKDVNGATLLYVACRSGQTAVAKWLLDKGANINAQLPEVRSTPLHGAAYHSHKSTVELLLSRGADTSIKNKFESTAYDDAKTEEIKKLLQRSQQDRVGEKIIPVHLYGDGKKSGDAPLATVQLGCEATINDLIAALPDPLHGQYRWFAVARSPFDFHTENTTLLSAVYRARHVCTKFIDLPVCLIAYNSPRYMNSGYTARSELAGFSVLDFDGKFNPICQKHTFQVKAASNKTQTFNIQKLQFDFAPNSAEHDIPLEVKYVFTPDAEQFQLQECICLFETNIPSSRYRLKEMPTVSINGESNVKLYTWLPNSGYWYSHSNLHARLPQMGSKHAIIRQVEIVPTSFYLLPDMFMQAAPGRVFRSRDKPVYCHYLKICEPNVQKFPHQAYHGTTLKVIRSILMDGLVMPNTVVSSGFRVCPPPNHIARGVSAFGIKDFANAIFVSPSIHYCSDPAYAVTFAYDDQQMIAVLECRVKKDSFGVFASTVPGYQPHSDDDINALEWRIDSPAAIQITGIMFIPVIRSRMQAARLRANKLGADPNGLK